jgi:Do/DeqQ family serine protease
MISRPRPALARLTLGVVLLIFLATGLRQAASQELAVPPSAPALNYSFAPVVERASPAVVNVYAQRVRRGAPLFSQGSALWRLFRDSLLFGYGRERIENSLGSGVVVRPDGIAVTNHHVIDGASGIAVVLSDGRVYQATVLLSDKRTDIAVLRVHAGGEILPFVEFGDSDRLRVGDIILAIGNPFGLEQTVTLGIVSALARTGVGITDLRFFIQSDAAINPGNSGGAQITVDGKLVGINTAIYTAPMGAQGLGFAIPSNMVRLVVQAAVEQKPLLRAWTGISGSSVPSQLVPILRLPRGRGVLVTDVYPGSPAEQAGIGQGDVILEVDDFPVADPQAMRYRIASRMIGDTVALSLWRRSMRVRIPVLLREPPAEPAANETRLPGLSPFSGATVASLSPALAEDLGLDSGIAGVVVLDVSPASAAERAGLRAGDIIRVIDDRRITEVEELLQHRARPFRSWSLILRRRGETLALRGR